MHTFHILLSVLIHTVYQVSKCDFQFEHLFPTILKPKSVNLDKNVFIFKDSLLSL